MHDPFLKSVFADPRMVEILVRRHVPEWADEIDPATLRLEPNELVSRKTLERRYPDLIWSATTHGGEPVLFLIDFQRKAERLMALRTTTYTSLALEDIADADDFSAGDALPEFVYLVLYHGDGPWKAPVQVTDLLQRSDPGRYRLVSWREQALDRFMVEQVDTMLQLRQYPERLREGGARTMAEMVDRFQSSLDELVQKGIRKGVKQGVRKGVKQGVRQGRVQVLRRLAARRFGEDTAGQLAGLLDRLPGSEGMDRVADALIECGTGEEFLERVRTA